MSLNARKFDRGDTDLRCPVRRDDDGTWWITGYAAAREFLRQNGTVQGGMGIDEFRRMPVKVRPPVIYQDGPEHRECRRRTARYFMPRRVAGVYRPTMVSMADQQIETLRRAGEVDLSELSLRLTVEVAAEVIGLTESKPGIEKRLERFFPDEFGMPGFTSLSGIYWSYRQVADLTAVYFADVRPAVKARRRQPKDDLISHLLANGGNTPDILIEAVTFAAAAMSTTREFILAAAWHLLTDEELRTRYLTSPEEGRIAVLHEILRLEPVIGRLTRRTTRPIEIAGVTVPQDATVQVRIDTANVDPEAAGDEPSRVCPGRDMAMGLSFGEGAHRCPGAHVAIHETDVFLHKLLSLDGVRMIGEPRLSYKPDISSYQVRGLIVSVQSQDSCPTGKTGVHHGQQ